MQLIWLLPLLIIYGWTRRHVPAERLRCGPRNRDLRVLMLVSLAAAALRGYLALTREGRNVDEYGYLALARFVESSGVSLFDCFVNLRMHIYLYLLGGDQSFALVDVVASQIVGVTGFVLGLLVLDVRKDRVAAWLTPPVYVFGIISFEGLTANSEIYANLFLALWLWLRLGEGLARAPRWRGVLSGAALALALLGKEQALVFLPLEPLLIYLRARSVDSAQQGPLLSEGARTAAGFVAVAALFLLVATLLGDVGAFLSRLWSFSAAGGDPHAASTLQQPPAWILVQGTYALLYFVMHTSALCFLGGGALTLLLRRDDRGAWRSLFVALALYLVIALVAASVGLRFFRHYFMLLGPALAPLAATFVVELWRQATLRGFRRAAPVCILLFGAFLVLREIAVLRQNPNYANGSSVPRDLEVRKELLEAAERTERATPPGERIFVGGWRPELYILADRAPASRAVSGGMFSLPVIFSDLERAPPATIVFPTWRGIAMSSWTYDPATGEIGVHRTFDKLEVDPAFVEWMTRNGYRQTQRTHAGNYLIFTRQPAPL